MMKSVLISIQPKWCELIASGKKTVEVRKTRPKIDIPFKCYIYCTQGKTLDDILTFAEYENGEYMGDYYANGNVIGEFICNDIKRIHCMTIEKEAKCAIADGRGDEEYYDDSCMSYKEAYWYLRNVKKAYGWHISDLVIYDKPKHIAEFVVEGDCTCENCTHCKWFERGNGYNVENDCLLPYTNSFGKAIKPLFRPPQSWCYVEGKEDERK